MKTQYTEAEETRIENEVEGVRETSDSSVASRGNVKNTLKEFNKHLEEHYYDTSEINYFFDKIWHFIKKHVINTGFFITALGKIRGSHVDSDTYSKTQNKPISIKSVDNLVDTLNTKFGNVEESVLDANQRIDELDEKTDAINERIDNIRTDFPIGFVYTEWKEEKSARELWPESFWVDISYRLGRPTNVNRIWKKYDYIMDVDCLEGLAEYNQVPADSVDFLSENNVAWLVSEANNYYKNLPTLRPAIERELKNCAYVIWGSKKYVYDDRGNYWGDDSVYGLYPTSLDVPTPSLKFSVNFGGSEANIRRIGGELYWWTGVFRNTQWISPWEPAIKEYKYVKIKHLIDSVELAEENTNTVKWVREFETPPTASLYITEEVDCLPPTHLTMVNIKLDKTQAVTIKSWLNNNYLNSVQSYLTDAELLKLFIAMKWYITVSSSSGGASGYGYDYGQ